MSTVTTIGLDIAKSVFQVHGISATGEVLIRRQVRRGQVLKFFASLPPCLIGIEACASAHHWSRELQSLGHEVRLMPPAYVKPYVKRQKNDMADAEAICEAVTRPTMRLVETKTCEQQSILMLHRVRQMQVRQRTMLTNAIRAHLAEFGLVAKNGRESVDELLLMVRDGDERVPELARPVSWLWANNWCWSSARSWRWTDASLPVIAPVRSAVGWPRSLGWVRYSPQLWWRMFPTRRLSPRAVISRLGSVWCQSRTPVVARSGSAG
jgi:hypothetical protein